MLTIRNLNKTYGAFRALNNVNLHIDKGELFGFVGANGAGKTTTMKICVGLLAADSGEIIIDGLRINTEKKTVTVDNETIRLTSTEYKILELLARNRGRIFTADDIYRAVWNEDRIVGDKAITVHVCHIREKIEINPIEPRCIKVV